MRRDEEKNFSRPRSTSDKILIDPIRRRRRRRRRRHRLYLRRKISWKSLVCENVQSGFKQRRVFALPPVAELANVLDAVAEPHADGL